MTLSRLVKSCLKFPLELGAANFGQHRFDSSDPRLWIMMYHRILPKSDPRYSIEEPGMIVEPETLRMHLQVLKSEFTIISLSEWIFRKKNCKPLPKKACAITFDDGWLDNYEYAWPILQQEQVPATLFAVPGMIETSLDFWPNRIAILLQQPIEKLKSIEWLSELIDKQTNSRETSAQVIDSLKAYSDDHLIELISQAEIELMISPTTTSSLMNWDQICELSDSGLVEIGSHTCQHIRLRQDIKSDIRFREISISKQQLQTRLNKPVELFCYPNGEYCEAAVREVSENYLAAVTTQGGINSLGSSNDFLLSRIGVHQDVSNNRRRLLARVANWP